MRRAWVFVTALALTACRDGAFRVVVDYRGFAPGCVKVSATDLLEPSRSTQVEVKPSTSEADGQLVVAVMQRRDWGSTLRLEATAHEGSCDGPAVSTASQEVSFERGAVREVALSLTANDRDGDRYVAAPEGSDCNDGDPAIRPGAVERCDGKDQDCNGTVDDGFEVGELCTAGDGCAGVWTCLPAGTRECQSAAVRWYPDLDGDERGDSAASGQVSCRAPDGGYVANADDCDDTRPNVYVSAPERCDALDNDCDQEIDEGFAVGSTCDAGCPGTVVCTPEGLARCEAASGSTAFADRDGDGAGDSTSTASYCGSVPEGFAAVGNDCDDGDPFTYPGAEEICDEVDNDCDGQPEGGGVCGSPTWASRSDTGGVHWRSASSFGEGAVWIAGEGGGLRVRNGQGDFQDYDGNCNFDLEAVWTAADGWAFVGGQSFVANHLAGSNACSGPYPAPVANIRGLVGFDVAGALQVYGVSGDGGSFLHVPQPSPTFTSFPAVGARLLDVHGLSPDLMFAVGGAQKSGGQVSPRIYRFDSQKKLWVDQGVQNLPQMPGGMLRSVHVVSARLAYAVGDQGLVLRWDGSAWSLLPAPAAVDLTGVIAFGTSQVYTSDRGGSVRKYDGSTWTEPYPAPLLLADPLNDITGSSPADLWAVGDNGRVVHWPE